MSKEEDGHPVNPTQLTLPHPEALHWRVKSSGVRQSEITKVSVLAGLGEELNNGYKCVQIKYKKTAWYGA